MPVEIKELVIRAVVDYSASGGGEVSGENSNVQSGHSVSVQDQTEIVQACVKQVMKILRQKQQR